MLPLTLILTLLISGALTSAIGGMALAPPKMTKRGIPISEHDEHYPVMISVYVPHNDEPITTTLKKRSVDAEEGMKSMHHEKLRIDITGAPTGRIQLALQLHQDFLSPTFKFIRGNLNASSFQTSPLPPPSHCYYKGRVIGHPSSIVALSTCDGLSGVIQTNETWVIHPLSNHTSGRLSKRDLADHVLVKDLPAQSTCLTNSTVWESRLNKTSDAGVASVGTKTIELMLVSDYERYRLLGSYTEPSILEIMNFLTLLLEGAGQVLGASTTLKITLAGVYTATTPMFASTGTTSSVDADTLLTTFCQWRYAKAMDPTLANTFFAKHDTAHLLTGRYVTSASVGTAVVQGYSYSGSICYAPSSCGFEVSALTPMLSSQAHVLLHELGHNLGSTHDSANNACNSSGYIMESSICQACGALSTQFSTCSMAAIQNFFATHDTSCLDNTPSLCGNGILDPGEECDSGNAQGSRCCTSSCRLTSGSSCDDANGPCCLNCAYLSKGTQCRAAVTGDARESCDLADTCSGTAAACPNTVRSNGTACYTDPSQSATVDGFCNRGLCQSRRAACASLGYTYDAGCQDASNPCILQCRQGNSCMSFTFPSAPPKSMFVPEFTACTLNGKSGSCVLGQCIPSAAKARAGGAVRFYVAQAFLLVYTFLFL